jgi:hypothetical protein
MVSGTRFRPETVGNDRAEWRGGCAMATRRTSSKPVVVDFGTARKLALALPEVAEGVCYGTPAFRVKNRLFARLWEDGETLVVSTDNATREALIKARPETFFVTDHYVGYDWMLVRLPAIAEKELRDLILYAWRRRAPAALVAATGARAK